jgi:hypothetical protein
VIKNKYEKKQQKIMVAALVARDHNYARVLAAEDVRVKEQGSGERAAIGFQSKLMKGHICLRHNNT